MVEPCRRRNRRSSAQPLAETRPSVDWRNAAGALPGFLSNMALAERQARMRASQLWHWLYVRGASDFSAMRNIAAEQRRAWAAQFNLARPQIVDRTGLWRRHPQMAIAFSAPRGGPAGRSRNRLYPRGRPRHAVRIEPSRLHAHLLVLPYRHAETGAQPDGGGNPRPDPGGARPSRRFSRRRSCQQARSCRPRAARSPISS